MSGWGTKGLVTKRQYLTVLEENMLASVAQSEDKKKLHISTFKAN